MTLDPIRWLGHASVRIDDRYGRVYIDPWKLSADAPPADLLLITHAHYDHFSPDDIARIRTRETVVLCTADVANALPGATVVAPDADLRIGPWRIRATRAYNIGKKFHPKGNGWVGYCVELSDGRIVYHAGDTDVIPEMSDVKADVAMLPCGGTYTMTGEEAGKAAQLIHPGLVLPIHWGDIIGTKADAERLKQLYASTVIPTT